MKALSVRSPWWFAILYMGKTHENRDWATRFRGTVYLHAGKWFNREEVADDWYECLHLMRVSGFKPPELPALTLDSFKEAGGCIVGKVDIVACVAQSDSPWFFGKYGFELRNPVPFKVPIPFKGALGFFDVPDSVGGAACEK